MENLFARSSFMRRSDNENVTIFSPSDEAMMDFEDDKNKQMVSKTIAHTSFRASSINRWDRLTIFCEFTE